MEVRPRHAAAQPLGHIHGNLRPETQMVDLVCESVSWLALWHIKVVLQIVHVHLPIAKTPPGGNVEVSYYFVDPEAPFNATPLVPLRIELLAVVLTFTLLDAFSSPKCP